MQQTPSTAINPTPTPTGINGIGKRSTDRPQSIRHQLISVRETISVCLVNLWGLRGLAGCPQSLPIMAPCCCCCCSKIQPAILNTIVFFPILPKAVSQRLQLSYGIIWKCFDRIWWLARVSVGIAAVVAAVRDSHRPH